MAKDTSASSSVLEWLAGGSEGVDRTAQVLDLIAAPVWVSDAKGTVVIANRCWRSLVASPQSSQAGYDLCTVLIPADRERLTTQLEQYRSQPQHFELEVSLVGNQKEADRHSEGQPICMTVEPVLSDDGEVNGWMGTCTEGRAKARLTRQLEVKQKFLDALLENLSDGIVACNSDGVLTLFNRATRDFHGLPKQPIPASEWAEHYNLYRADATTPLETDEIPLFRALKGESVKNAAIAIAPKHGRQRFVLANGDPIVTKDGQQLGAVVAMRDITVQRQAELHLLESQNRYRLLAENLQDLLVEHATNGDIRYASTSAQTLIGYDGDELVGKSLLSLMHPDDVAAFRQTTSVSGLSALPSRAQYRICHKNGSYRWFESSSSVVADDVGIGSNNASDGAREVVISVLRDITDRKQFEAAICELNETLEERVLQRTAALEQANSDIQSLFEREQTALSRLSRSEQEYRSVVTGIRDIIFKLDFSGNLVFLNPAWMDILGFDVAESLGKSFVEFMSDEDRPAFQQQLEQLKQGSLTEGSLELKLLTAEGEQRWLEMDAQLLEATQSLPTGIGGILVDITDRKESEALLQRRATELETINSMLLQTTALAEQRNQELDQFAYVTSHDLKAPLRAIANLSLWIEEDLDAVLTDETRQQMNLLRSRVKRMEALINGLLQYSRVGRMAEDAQPVDVAELLEEVLDMLGIPPVISIEIEGKMPAIVSERLPLQQVLSNLIGNAVKHRDRPEGRVKISVTRDRDVVVFAISDDGRGIAAQYHEKIFTIFQTLEARDKVESTGIGLSIVKKIVTARGGTIKVQSQVGEGSTFAFTWPATAAT